MHYFQGSREHGPPGGLLKYDADLITVLQQVISEPVFYDDLV